MRTSDLPSRRRRSLGVLALALLLGMATALGPSASARGATELRGDIPTGDEVRAERADIAAERARLLAGLTHAERSLTEVLGDRDRFDEQQRRLAAQIEAATAHLRSVAVRAFITGGDIGDLEYLLQVGDASELSWRRSLLRNHAGSRETALRRLEDLEVQADDEVRRSIDEAAALRDEITTIERDMAALGEREAQVEAVAPLAEAWDRAAIAIEEGRYGIAPPEKWARLRFCESSDDYGAISPTGKYRGAYQFDYATWQTVGGTGDPAAAPAAEQDARARELYARRGHEPWPECGFHLR